MGNFQSSIALSVVGENHHADSAKPVTSAANPSTKGDSTGAERGAKHLPEPNLPDAAAPSSETNGLVVQVKGPTDTDAATHMNGYFASEVGGADINHNSNNANLKVDGGANNNDDDDDDDEVSEVCGGAEEEFDDDNEIRPSPMNVDDPFINGKVEKIIDDLKRDIVQSPGQSLIKIPVVGDPGTDLKLTIDTLKNRSSNWTKKLRALQHLDDLVKDAGVTSLPSWWEMGDNLAESVNSQLRELRHPIVRQTCVLILTIADKVGGDERFAPFVTSILPSLFEKLTVSTLVLSTAADDCIRGLLKRAKMFRYHQIPSLADAAVSYNHALVRFCCTDYLARLLLSINSSAAHLKLTEAENATLRERTEAQLDLIGNVISTNEADADSYVRRATRQLFQALKLRFPEYVKKQENLTKNFSRYSLRIVVNKDIDLSLTPPRSPRGRKRLASDRAVLRLKPRSTNFKDDVQ